MVEKLAGATRSRLRDFIGHLDGTTMTAVARALLLVFGFCVAKGGS